MAERQERGLLDTSVVVDLQALEAAQLPREGAVSAITMAELAAGPAAAKDPNERAVRQDRLQRTEATFESIPFGTEAARVYGRIYGAAIAGGRRPRSRVADLMIAAVAVAEGLPLFTRNPEDFVGLEELVEVIAV